ncbi:MAG: hypothetical protein AAFZ65_02975 [Planctomycetota bacterium]
MTPSSIRLLIATLVVDASPLSAQSPLTGVAVLPANGCAFADSWPIEVTGSSSIGQSLRLDPSMPDLTVVAVGFDLTLRLPIPNNPSLIGLNFGSQPCDFDGLPSFTCSVPGGFGTFALGDAVEITIQR